MRPSVSFVIPAYNEAETIRGVLEGVLASSTTDLEVVVVYDTPEDTTAEVLQTFFFDEPRVKPTLNTYGRGPANALRFGFDHVTAPITVVMRADGSDDPADVDALTRLVERGAVIAAASRYMRGGRQIGGPILKRILSRLAGLILYHLGRVGTRDATNSFKAYSTEFTQAVGISSKRGFEMGIELVAKARRARMKVDETPTTWRDRETGESRFRVATWIPHYMRWFLFAFGPRLTTDDIARRTAGRNHSS